MSTKKINELQATDADGNPVLNCNTPVDIYDSATTVLMVGAGVLLGITIWAEVADGTFYFTNTAGTAITGLPKSTKKATTSYAGAFAIPRLEIAAGLKIVTESATGLVGTGWAFQGE